MTDIEILRAAYKREFPDGGTRSFGGWQSHQVGATRSDITHLKDSQLICTSTQVAKGQESFNIYRLTSKGINVMKGYSEETEAFQITAAEVMQAMDMIVGYEDIKTQIANIVEQKKQAHLLFHGPPASAKSVILESLRGIIPNSMLAFGSRTSAAGISDQLFELKPSFLLLDELDKVDRNSFSVLLGLMQSGEVIETKSRKTRGVILSTTVMAAANNIEKLTPELISRFIPLYFKRYTRQQFIDVTVGYLARSSKGCPEDIGRLIGELVYDNNLGDVRKGKQIKDLMFSMTTDEVYRAVGLLQEYSPPFQLKKRAALKAQPSMI